MLRQALHKAARIWRILAGKLSRRIFPDPMTSAENAFFEITPQVLLKAYACGIFPMAESASDNSLFWVEPEYRGIFPLTRLHVSRSLAKAVRRDDYEIRIDHDFEQVMDACAGSGGWGEKRPTTWISERIRRLYRDLFDLGFVHTVEVWRHGVLIGGLYGVSLKGAFFGESMFHRARDASKIALVHLVARLRAGGYTLLDAQFITPHLASLGAIEVSRESYHDMLADALETEGNFHQLDLGTSGAVALQLTSHTS